MEKAEVVNVRTSAAELEATSLERLGRKVPNFLTLHRTLSVV